jgi:hypothetical protein
MVGVYADRYVLRGLSLKLDERLWGLPKASSFGRSAERFLHDRGTVWYSIEAKAPLRPRLHLGASSVSRSLNETHPPVDNANPRLHPAPNALAIGQGHVVEQSLLFGVRSLGGGAYASAPS